MSDLGALAPFRRLGGRRQGAKGDEYRAGKTGLLGFFAGPVIAAEWRKGKPALVTQLAQERGVT